MKNKYKYTLLFIEDEEAIRKNYVSYFNMLFETVYEAADGEEAYQIYKEKKPDIMIIDINIPKLNGIDLLKKIREKDHSTKAIMLTAHSDVSFLLKATGLKLTKYLIKPVSRDELKSALNIALEELSKFSVVSKKTLTLDEDHIWDCELEELKKDSKTIKLTNKEKKVLKLLITNPEKTFTPDDIIFEVWDDYNEGNFSSLRTIIKNLRKKVPKEMIKNIFGIGYKIELTHK